MPTVIKSSSNVAKLGDLSTYTVSTSAIPYDTADSSGAIPTVNTTLTDGVNTDYLIGESLTLANPALGSLTGEVVEVSGDANSNRYTLSAETIMSRLNSEQRLYPSPSKTVFTNDQPLGALEYWSQHCGVFYDAVEGSVLFYASHYYHWFAYAKGITRPVRGLNPGSGAGEAIGSNYLSGTRYVSNFGKNRDLIITLPDSQPLPVQIPATTENKHMVFSTGLKVQGTGRQGAITWEFTTPTKRKAYLQAAVDSAGNVLVMARNSGAAYTTIGTISGASNGVYQLNIGIQSINSTQSTITFNVLSAAGAELDRLSKTITSNLRGNLSLISVTYRGEDQGSGSHLLHWGDSISLMNALPTRVPVVQKSLTPGVKQAQTFVGFSGNVWEHIKQFCSIYHLDVSYKDGKFTVGPRQTETTQISNLGTLSKRIANREQARYVEVVNHNSVATVSGGVVVPRVMFSADTVYQVAVGETEEFLVQTDHSILELQQPVAVTGISPFPYKTGSGQYVVTGSDGYIVSPTFWRDQGGLVTVDTTENEGEIKITIKGPDFDSPRAPYRISEGDAGRPALHITGHGVINTPQTLKVATGNAKAAKEVGTTVDSPFIANTALAFDAAARAASVFATPEITVSLAEALDYDTPSDLGTAPAGQLIKRDGNILRVVDASQTPAALSGTAVQHNTIRQVVKSFGTANTIGEVNAYHAGKTIGQTNLKPLKAGQ